MPDRGHQALWFLIGSEANSAMCSRVRVPASRPRGAMRESMKVRPCYRGDPIYIRTMRCPVEGSRYGVSLAKRETICALVAELQGWDCLSPLEPR